MKNKETIVKGCPAWELADKCECVIHGCSCTECSNEDCSIKQIVENLQTIVNSSTCDRCYGCGYENGCIDKTCSTYQAHKCLELLDVQEVEL